MRPWGSEVMARSGRGRSEEAASPRGYGKVNRATWDRIAAWYERHNEPSLRRDGGKAWGIWRIPERELRLLGNVRGKRVLELGCGAAWWSIALARDGARVVGLDFSAARLAQARARMTAAGVSFPLVQARAERIPFPSGRFDLVLSDYGATTFTDPYRTIPEAARVLDRGGRFVFAHASPFRSLAEHIPSDRLSPRLRRDYFGLHTIRSPDSVEFQLPYGEWIRLFAACGLAVERLVEPAPPPGRQSTYVSRAGQRWARHWPIEMIWQLRKTTGPRGGATAGGRRDGAPRPRSSGVPPRSPTRRRRTA